MKRGQKIGPYVVQERIGRGAMGEVWLAKHPDLGHRYALKVLGRHLLEDKTALKRFEVEMEGLARVDGHPGIVRVHSAGRTRDGLPWIAMEYVSGRQLSAALKDGLPRREALELLLQVARALGHAHARGLVHRDVKPDNVLVGEDGAARLTDFGLAKLLDREQRLTRTQDLVGTPFYLAPEQANQAMGDVGPWSDVYSLGAVMYEALVGEPPHMGTTTVEVCTKVVQDPIVPPSLRRDGIPPAVEAVCLKALSRDQRARYRDGSELAEALAQALASLPKERPEGASSSEEPGPQGPLLLTEKERRARDRRRLWAAVALGALLLVGAGVTSLLLQAQDARRVAQLETLARETGAAAAALERRLRSGTGEAAAALVELARLEAALPQESLPEVETAREAVHRAEELARIEVARIAWQEGRTGDARVALGPEPTRGPADPCRAWILLLSGDARGALAATPALPPLARAQAAAWVGDLAACQQALEALPQEQAKCLVATLREQLPQLREKAHPAGESPGSAHAPEWVALAASSTHLADGFPALAAVELAPLPAGAGAELVAAHALHTARLALSRGELDPARESARAAARAAETADPPLVLERVAALSLLGQLEAESAEGASRAALERLAPGLPELLRARGRERLQQAWSGEETADPEPLLAAPVSALDRARAAARKGDPRAGLALLAPLVGSDPAQEASFLQLERRACARGLDGPVGLLLSRAAAQAELALAAGSWEGAALAERLSAPLLRLRADSPLLWLAQSSLARTLHQPGRALAAAERALRLSPGDPAALLARARALLAGQVHGLPEGGDPHAPGLRADLARIRGLPETTQELSAAEALGPALEAFQSALSAAKDGPGAAQALAQEARLGAAEVLLEQARRRVLGGGARLEDVPLELSRLESELAPLLQPVNVPELARARTRLGAALQSGEEGEVQAAEEALAEARPACDRAELRRILGALRLRAMSGLAGSEAYGDAFLALAADLPARAAWCVESAASGADEAEALGRALRLDPHLPPALLMEHYLSTSGGQAEVPRCRRLARLVLEAPAVAGLAPLLAGLVVTDPDTPLPEELLAADDPEGCVARALASASRHSALMWRRMGARAADGERLGKITLAAMERARQLEPARAGVHLLLTRALIDLARQDPTARGLPGTESGLWSEAGLAARAAAAGLPWGLGPRVSLLSIVPEDELRAAALEVFVRGGGELLRQPDTRMMAVRSTTRRRELSESLGKRLSAEPPDLSDPRALLEAAQELDEPKHGRAKLGLILRLRAATVRARAEACLPPVQGGFSDHLRQRLFGPPPLGPDPLQAVAATLDPGMGALARAHASLEPGPAAGELALRALWLSLPAGELAGPLELGLEGRPFALPASAPEMHRSLLRVIQPQGGLWECGQGLRSRAVALRRLRALAPPKALPAPGAGPQAAFLPWSAPQALLQDPQDARAWEELLMVSPPSAPEELRLLLDRACALERGEGPQPTAARLGVLTRALALQPERGRERPRLLAAGVSLLLAARRLAGAPPASLVMTLADLRLDRLAGEGERATEVEAARQDAEASARDAREAHGTPTPGQPALSRWSLARARALAGDEEGAAAALAEAGRLLEQDPVLVVPFRAWVARDPWLGELRRRPRLARFLGAWVPE